jgi:glutamyl-tRNA synthetase
MEALEWLGIPPDETKNENLVPSTKERKPLYRDYADQLINTGWAYYAFDSAEALDAARKEQEEQGKTFIYNHTNREILDTSLVFLLKKLPKESQMVMRM